jgi:hypothetical protein
MVLSVAGSGLIESRRFEIVREIRESWRIAEPEQTLTRMFTDVEPEVIGLGSAVRPGTMNRAKIARKFGNRSPK